MRSFLKIGLLAGFGLALIGCGDPPPPDAVCGNGTLETGEVCDDGNTAGGDGCSAACDSDETCGNNVLDAGEQCDDGNTVVADGCDGLCFIEACGNGFLDAGEVCDDGNEIDGDGCEGDCLSVTDPAVLCAAATVANLGDTAGDVSDGAAGFEPDPAGGCAFGAPGFEVLFTFTPAANGTATVTVTPDGADGLDPAVYARANCVDDTSELACADDGLDDDPETITFAVTAGTAVTLVVDSFNAAGSFTMNIAVQ